MSNFMRLCLILGVAVAVTWLPISYGEEPDPVNKLSKDAQVLVDLRFNRDVRPILSNHCFKCHGPDLKKGGLDLQNREAALKELKSGLKAIVPGKSGESELIQRVIAEEENQRMPPKGSKPLSAKEIATLRAWIDQGAPYEEHWAYVKPARPPLPPVKDKTWPRNGIDYFVLARLEQEGLTPAPEADRAALIRRVSLDLTGLPPTVQEVDAFLADKSPDAYEKVVDRLLASPHYGEHQARPWLDQARYADTNGYEKDDRRTIWPYRDWVVNALNADMPFDRFTIEQIAGDLLPNPTLQQKIATGFHRNTMVNTEGGTDDEEFRVAAIVDRVNTTMEVWMGTTMACAQCHNHKYDPFSQKEYYQLFAFFNSTADRGRSNEPTIDLLTPEQLTQRTRRHAKMAHVQTTLLTSDPFLTASLLVRSHGQITEWKQQERDLRRIGSTLVMQELPKPRQTHVHVRGNHTSKGELVSPGVPAKWHPLPPGAPANRLGLARWLVDPNNPLVSRVTVNRIWARYFGRGIVETSEDFGTRGELPTHPELLDWLACEFMTSGGRQLPDDTTTFSAWSMKKMHRLITTSATYRQSARVSREVLQRDPYNRLFTRGPRFRMEAEMVRDNALAISGLLNRKLGGPSVFPYQPEGIWNLPYNHDRWVMSTGGDQYRRGLYTFWRRTAPYASFMAFDAPSREVACERRPRTNTPLQALATLNDKVFVECSVALAGRMMTEAKGDEKARAAYGFRLCVARPPSSVELDHLVSLYRDSLKKYRKDPAAARALAGTDGAKVASEGRQPPDAASAGGLPPDELAAWTVVANVLLNLDETITK